MLKIVLPQGIYIQRDTIQNKQDKLEHVFILVVSEYIHLIHCIVNQYWQSDISVLNKTKSVYNNTERIGYFKSEKSSKP